ncbi:carbohydrate-binding protein [Natrinema salaciae]|uniref:carbohydrate-binding protein n=1 Tax=Natrinema salaciae TaxID=1186196 RepID=UPI0015874CFB|nr:carbohydrate-binding protein [Natrinema salaciae]
MLDRRRFLGAASGVAATAAFGVPASGATTSYEYAPFFQMGVYDPREETAKAGVSRIHLANIKSDGNGAPVWHDTENLPASRADLVRDLQAQGVTVSISVGGYDTRTMALDRSTVEGVVDAYLKIVDELGVTHFDINDEYRHDESADLRDYRRRRNKALVKLQNRRPEVSVGYTVPSHPEGLTNTPYDDWINVKDYVKHAVDVGVDIEYLTLMTHGLQPTTVDKIQSRLTKTHDILGQWYPGKSATELWQMLGCCPLLGKQINKEDYFHPYEANGHPDEADELARWAADKGLGMMAPWALNRDRPGEPGDYPLVGDSGLPGIKTYEFSQTFLQYAAPGGGGSQPTQSPYNRSSGWPVPGRIQAEDFDEGGSMASFTDSTAGNEHGAYRDTNVDIEESTEDGYNISYIRSDEWLEYTIDVKSAGTYDIYARVAGPNKHDGGSFSVDVDGSPVATASFGPTGGWQEWTTVHVGSADLSAGEHVVRITSSELGYNLNWFAIRNQSPYGRTTGWPVPGTIQAEDFDEGGSGVAYSDSTPGNEGSVYRDTNVDIHESTEDGYNVAWIRSDEWLEYTVDVQSTGTYDIYARVAGGSSYDGGELSVAVDGSSVATASFGPTGGWQEWTTVHVGTADLEAGEHVVRVTTEEMGYNLNRIKFE